MKFLRSITFLVALSVAPCLYAASAIIKIDSFEQARAELETATSETLVMFDLDRTIWNPTERFFDVCEFAGLPMDDFDVSDHEFVKGVRENIQILSAQNAVPGDPYAYQVNLFSSICAKTNFVPVEASVIAMIKDLQERGVKVIALTSSSAGRFGVIPNEQEWRLYHLRKLGVDFGLNLEIKELDLPEVPKKYNLDVLFSQGVLSAALNPKGDVLTAFLKKIFWRSKKIIFFDDSRRHCENVAAAMEKLGIETICYWYRGAYQKKIKIDKELIQRQFDYWAAHEEFLNTEEMNALSRSPV